MSKRLPLPARKRHLEIFEEDWLFLDEHFGRGSGHKIGVGNMIRSIVHAHVKALREKQVNSLDKLGPAQSIVAERIMERIAGVKQALDSEKPEYVDEEGE